MFDRKEWAGKNKEHLKKYHKRWYIKNRERELKKSKKWKENNNEYHKNHYLKNKDKIKKQSKERHENNPKYYEQWQRENKKKFLECKRRWLKSEKGKASNQRSHIKRRVKEKKIINTLTCKEWLAILKKFDYKCAYCGKDLFDLFTKPEKDHFIPISKGGDNTKDNVVPACRSCNAKKHNRIFKEVRFQ